MRGVLLVGMVLGVSAVRGAGEGVAPEAGAVRFLAMEVVVDSGKAGLGAYQVEVSGGKAVLVGVEGGEGVYGEAPFYDPKALAGGRVVLGAFHVGGGLPAGKVRVARLHWMVNGEAGEAGGVTGKVVVATDGVGKEIEASVRVVPFEGDR